MKKWLAIILIVVLALPHAYAQEAEETALRWKDFAPAVQEQEWEGRFETVEQVGLEVWLPDFLQPSVLDGEETALYGYIAYYENEAHTCFFGVTMAEQNLTREDALEWLEKNGARDAELISVNDIPAIRYGFDKDGYHYSVVTIVYGDGQVLEFAFTAPAEEFDDYPEPIAASIRIVQERVEAGA